MITKVIYFENNKNTHTTHTITPCKCGNTHRLLIFIIRVHFENENMDHFLLSLLFLGRLKYFFS